LNGLFHNACVTVLTLRLLIRRAVRIPSVLVKSLGLFYLQAYFLQTIAVEKYIPIVVKNLTDGVIVIILCWILMIKTQTVAGLNSTPYMYLISDLVAWLFDYCDIMINAYRVS